MVGSACGRVTDAALFEADAIERARLLSPFAWAEFRAPLRSAPDPWTLAAAGFAFADAHIAFRIRLQAPAVNSSSMHLQTRFADEQSFDPGAHAVRAFAHERFQPLPGATEARVAARYLTWARQLVGEYPDWCVEVFEGDAPQGWFCCQGHAAAAWTSRLRLSTSPRPSAASPLSELARRLRVEGPAHRRRLVLCHQSGRSRDLRPAWSALHLGNGVLAVAC